MAAHDLRFLYKETRLSLDSPASTVHVRLPGQPGAHRPGSRKVNGTESSVLEEEKAFRAKSLATASNIYHRAHHDSPRSFLWRVLDDGHVLSLQAFDLTREEKEAEAPLVLNIHFPTPIRPSCVGLSDPKEHDALAVFVLDQASVLYSLILRPEAFRRRSAAELGSGNECSTYSSSVFSFKHPHRLVPVHSDLVLVTLHDGGLLKLERNRAHNAQSSNAWKETSYNAQHWTSGFRRMLPFQGGPTVRYGNINMELSAATSTAIRSSRDGSDSVLFSVCLDHHMRIWNVASGQIMYSADLLKTNHKLEDIGKWTVDPALSNLIRLVDVSETKSLVVTYSPVGQGQFKLWRVDMGDDKTVFVHDYFPATTIAPPSPSHSEAWILADFGIVPVGNGRGELWVIWKNNVTYRVQRTEFCTREDAVLAPWENGCDSVFIDLTAPTAQSSGPSEPSDPAEKWLQLIFAPGRFSTPTLRTALAMYERGLGSSRHDASRASKGLAESICAVIGATTALDRNADDEVDYEQFRATSEIHWRRFYRLLMELDKQRGEALALVLDPATGLVAVACADFLSVARKTGDLDRVCHNLLAPTVKSEPLFCLVSAGLAFVESFSDGMWQLSKAALQAELFDDSSKTDEERMQSFSDKAGFWRQISEEDCAQVVETLGDKFMTVTPAVYQDLFASIAARDDAMSQETRHPFTEPGRHLVVRGVQDAADLQWQILFSQLILLVHMEFEFDEESDALHSRFDVGSIYRQLLDALKRLEHIKWLCRTELSVPGLRTERTSSTNGSPAAARPSIEASQPTTAFELIVGHLFGLTDQERRSLYSGLTDIIVNMCAPDSDTELLPHIHQCWLLKQDRPDLALELSPFCDQDPFPTYVQGRTFLALKDFDTAAQYFRKAAYGLSISNGNTDRHSARLLDDTEWRLFNAGLPSYYSHIISLYERLKAYNHIIEFSRLAVQLAVGQDNEQQKLRTDILSRLFTASTAISDFEVAHSALIQIHDEALQKACLKKLVEKMCELSQSTELITFPFAGLQSKVDGILRDKAQSTKDAIGQPGAVPYHKVLYAWRISHGDHRGAAEVLLDRLRKLQALGLGDEAAGEDIMDTPVTRQFLLLINALCCVGADEQWVLEESQDMALTRRSEASFARLKELGEYEQGEVRPLTEASVTAESKKEDHSRVAKVDATIMTRLSADLGSRRLLTLDSVRKQYQDELDRVAAIQNNQFEFVDDDDVLMATA